MSAGGYSEEDIARLRLIRSKNIGPSTFHQLVENHGSATSALESLTNTVRAKDICPTDIAHQEVQALESSGGRLVFWDDQNYSRLLREIVHPPPVLCVYGQVSLMATPAIAIVGARNASAAGRKFTAALANALTDKGYTIVSGLARGVDTAAHKGATPAKTIAVMAGGIDVTYPPENEDLHKAIAENGLVISEMPFSFRPKAEHFPRRNRLVSGLSLGVVVVEAAERSGSLITARLAGEQGRDVFAVPGSPLDPRSAGTNALIRQGATLIRNADDVMDGLHREPALFAKLDKPERSQRTQIRPPSQKVRLQKTSPAETPGPSLPASDLIMSCLSQTPVEIDEIVRQTNIKAGDVLGLLMELELEGKCKLHPGQKVALT